MGLRWIGPVEIPDHVNPFFGWTGAVDAHGLQPARISGEADWRTVIRLGVLVPGDARTVTVAGVSGVLEPVWWDDDLLFTRSGWYLLQSIDRSPDTVHSFDGLDGVAPFSLTLTRVPDRLRPVVGRSASERASDFAVTTQSVVATPFWDSDAASSPFLVSGGGGYVARQYDANDYSPGQAVSARFMTMEIGVIVAGVDSLSPVVVPRLAPVNGAIPEWVSSRGGDVYAYDRGLGIRVDGPDHLFGRTTDILLTNGLLRLWVGVAGLSAYVQVSAQLSGVWHHVGVVTLGTANLVGARLTRLTPDEGTIALELAGQGEVLVSLGRSERMVRIEHGTEILATSVAREVGWSAVPPSTVATGLSFGDATFGRGVWVSGDLQHSWPPHLITGAWTVACRWLPPGESADSVLTDETGATITTEAGDPIIVAAQPDSGIWSLLTGAGAEISTMTYDSATDSIVWTEGASALSVGPLSLSLPADVAIIASRSATGRTLTVRSSGAAMSASDTVPALAAISTIRVGRSGATYAAGPVDNLLLFEGTVTMAEAAALASATVADGGLPDPESRLVMWVPYDADVPAAALAGGIAVAATDSAGLARTLLTHDDAVVSGAGMTMTLTATRLAVGASVTIPASASDTPADHHAQYRGESYQRTLMRS